MESRKFNYNIYDEKTALSVEIMKKYNIVDDLVYIKSY